MLRAQVEYCAGRCHRRRQVVSGCRRQVAGMVVKSNRQEGEESFGETSSRGFPSFSSYVYFREDRHSIELVIEQESIQRADMRARACCLSICCNNRRSSNFAG